MSMHSFLKYFLNVYSCKRTDEGKPWILPVVKKAEAKLAEMIEAEQINHEYLPVLGYDKYQFGKIWFNTRYDK